MTVQGCRSMGIFGIALAISGLIYFIFHFFKTELTCTFGDMLPLVVSLIILVIAVALMNVRGREALSILYALSDVILGSGFIFIAIYDVVDSQKIALIPIVNIVLFLATVLAGLLYLLNKRWYRKYSIMVTISGIIMGSLLLISGLHSIFVALRGSLMPEIGLALGKFFLLMSLMMIFYYGNHLLLARGLISDN